MSVRRLLGVALLGCCIAVLAVPSVIAQGTNRRYLPIAISAPFGTIIFGTAADANGIPTPPTTDIPPGSRQLFYNARVTGGAAGLPYRLEWTINGQRVPDIDDPRAGDPPVFVQTNPDDISGVICFTRPDTECDTPTGTLQPGSYTVRLFVNNVQIAESTATVRAALDQIENDPAAELKRSR